MKRFYQLVNLKSDGRIASTSSVGPMNAAEFKALQTGVVRNSEFTHYVTFQATTRLEALKVDITTLATIEAPYTPIDAQERARLVLGEEQYRTWRKAVYG